MTDSPSSNPRCDCPNGSYGQKHTTACYEATIERLRERLAEVVDLTGGCDCVPCQRIRAAATEETGNG